MTRTEKLLAGLIALPKCFTDFKMARAMESRCALCADKS
jgi:hypothetical protein